MSEYSDLKATINANIKANNNQEITGPVMNSVLNAMVNTLGAEYQFAGVATIDTNPGTPDAKVFYIANGKGTYTNFENIIVDEGEVAILKWDTAWTKEVTGIANAEQLNQLGQEVGVLSFEASFASSASNQYIPLIDGIYIYLHNKPYKLIIESISFENDGWRLVEETTGGTNYLVPDSVGVIDRNRNDVNRISVYLKGNAGAGHIKFKIVTSFVYDLERDESAIAENARNIAQNTSDISKNSSDISEIKNDIYENVAGENLIATETESGYILRSDGATIANAGYTTKKFNVANEKRVFITGRSAGGSWALCVAFASDDSVLQAFEVGKGTDYEDLMIVLPENTSYIKVTDDSTEPKAKKDALVTDFYTKSETYNKTEVNDLVGASSYWKNKKLWWCGTSIPYGTGGANNYPYIVGQNLGCSINNVSMAGSMCRANVRTGNYDGANITNITRALSMTLEEVETFIENYDSIKGNLTGDVPQTKEEFIAQGHAANMRNATFETKLLPYLNGTYPMPDLFVIDHGHNDFKYTLQDDSSDIGLEPTRENITNGVLAEDTFMTANNNAKLASFLGSLDNIQSTKLDEFVCSLNRNCFEGAINFIITLILKYNPKARIVFVSNYEYENGNYPSYAPLINAQKANADSWAFPLCEVYKYLGYSNHIIPGTKNLYAESGYPFTYDVNVFKVYCPDTVHPHSDPTGDADNIYAGVISEFIKTCR